MKCPVCDVDLTMADRQGIEIDYCPQCRGIWLDRGELDKVIDRSASFQSTETRNEGGFGERRYQHIPSGYSGHHHEHQGHRRKKKSFLQDFFDFD
jgi:uncharacterized protein